MTRREKVRPRPTPPAALTVYCDCCNSEWLTVSRRRGGAYSVTIRGDLNHVLHVRGEGAHLAVENLTGNTFTLDDWQRTITVACTGRGKRCGREHVARPGVVRALLANGVPRIDHVDMLDD